MLHYLDDMDAKVNGIQQFLKTKVPEGIEVERLPPPV